MLQKVEHTPRQQTVSATACCQPWYPYERSAKLTLFQPGSYPGIDHKIAVASYIGYIIIYIKLNLTHFCHLCLKGCLRHGASFILFWKYQPHPRSQIFSTQNSSHDSKGQKTRVNTHPYHSQSHLGQNALIQ